MMEIRVDRETCIGNAMCVALAPNYFELDEENKVRVLRATVDEGDEEASCPVAAITLHP